MYPLSVGLTLARYFQDIMLKGTGCFLGSLGVFLVVILFGIITQNQGITI